MRPRSVGSSMAGRLGPRVERHLSTTMLQGTSRCALHRVHPPCTDGTPMALHSPPQLSLHSSLHSSLRHPGRLLLLRRRRLRGEEGRARYLGDGRVPGQGQGWVGGRVRARDATVGLGLGSGLGLGLESGFGDADGVPVRGGEALKVPWRRPVHPIWVHRGLAAARRELPRGGRLVRVKG